MKGRKPRPTRLQVIAGNPGGRPLNANEAELDLSQPDPPAFLCEDGREEWSRVVQVLFDAGLMTDLDRGALAAYCQAYGRWAAAERALREMSDKDRLTKGMVIKTTNGNAIQNPLVGIANKALHEMVRCASEFGMTPSARSRVDAKPPSKGNKFANNGKGKGKRA